MEIPQTTQWSQHMGEVSSSGDRKPENKLAMSSNRVSEQSLMACYFLPQDLRRSIDLGMEESQFVYRNHCSSLCIPVSLTVPTRDWLTWYAGQSGSGCLSSFSLQLGLWLIRQGPSQIIILVYKVRYHLQKFSFLTRLI